MQLRFELSPNWAQFEMKDGPATFHRDSADAVGALQVSWAAYQAGPAPNPTADSLEQMAVDFGHKQQLSNMLGTARGDCEFGSWATAIFRSAEFTHFQVWFLSNGRDFIMATYICSEPLNSVEIQEAQSIVESLGLTAD
jgi:hypothetical protein